jgi:hypothetical protein
MPFGANGDRKLQSPFDTSGPYGCRADLPGDLHVLPGRDHDGPRAAGEGQDVGVIRRRFVARGVDRHPRGRPAGRGLGPDRSLLLADTAGEGEYVEVIHGGGMAAISRRSRRACTSMAS